MTQYDDYPINPEDREYIETSEELVPASHISLPVIVDERTGRQRTDWDKLFTMPANDKLIVDYLVQDLSELVPDQIRSVGTQLLSMHDRGLLPTMRDVFEITQFAVERNPNMSMVIDQMADNGYSADQVGILWDVRDSLGISVEQTHTIFRELSFDLLDEKDIELIDGILDAIENNRGFRRHTAASVIIEGIKDGKTLREIAEERT